MDLINVRGLAVCPPVVLKGTVKASRLVGSQSVETSLGVKELGPGEVGWLFRYEGLNSGTIYLLKDSEFLGIYECCESENYRLKSRSSIKCFLAENDIDIEHGGIPKRVEKGNYVLLNENGLLSVISPELLDSDYEIVEEDNILFYLLLMSGFICILFFFYPIFLKMALNIL